MQVDIVISRLDPIDLAPRQKENSAFGLDDQSLEITMLRPHAFKQRHELLVNRLCGLSLYLEARALKRLLKTFAVERLQQVIDRIYLKCLQRVLVVSGHEDNRGHRFDTEGLDHFKPVH